MQTTGSYASPGPPQPLPSTSCSAIAYGAPSQAGSDSKALLSVALQSDGRHFEFDIHYCMYIAGARHLLGLGLRSACAASLF